MKDVIYIIAIIVTGAICFIGGYVFDKPKAYKRGWKAGSASAVEWLAFALAESGFTGKQLSEILTMIARHLEEFRKGFPSAQSEEPAGNNEQ